MKPNRALRRHTADGALTAMVGMATHLANDQGPDHLRENVSTLLADELVSGGVTAEIARLAHAAIRSPATQQAIRERVASEIDDIVRAELANRADEIEARIKAGVTEQIDTAIANAARRIVDEEIERFRKRFSNG